jgi:hypothetical protein
MNNQSTLQFYARAAGVLYLIITIAAVIAHFYVPGELIVADDTTATIANITASESLFELGIASEFVVLLSELVLLVLLYVLFEGVNRPLALIAAVARLAMIVVHGVNLLNYFFVQLVINEPGISDAWVGVFLDAHAMGFTVGIVFLVLHVFALSYLIFTSGFFPRVLGALFFAAAVGYSVDSFGLLFIDDYTETPAIIAMTIAIAEIAFPIWLLVKGVGSSQTTIPLSTASAQS